MLKGRGREGTVWWSWFIYHYFILKVGPKGLNEFVSFIYIYIYILIFGGVFVSAEGTKHFVARNAGTGRYSWMKKRSLKVTTIHPLLWSRDPLHHHHHLLLLLVPIAKGPKIDPMMGFLPTDRIFYSESMELSSVSVCWYLFFRFYPFHILWWLGCPLWRQVVVFIVSPWVLVSHYPRIRCFCSDVLNEGYFWYCAKRISYGKNMIVTQTQKKSLPFLENSNQTNTVTNFNNYY